MSEYRVRLTRVRRVVEQVDVFIEATSEEEAEELAHEVDETVEAWEVVDASTEHFDATVNGD